MSLRLKAKIAHARFRYKREVMTPKWCKIILSVLVFGLLLDGLYTKFPPKVIYIENVSANESTIETTQGESNPVEVSSKDSEIERIADTIWLRESTRGKNNYSKCKEQGLTNGVGYGIPGDGTYKCYQNHEEEIEVVKRWIQRHFDEGMTEIELMCHYSGNNYKECRK